MDIEYCPSGDGLNVLTLSSHFGNFLYAICTNANCTASCSLFTVQAVNACLVEAARNTSTTCSKFHVCIYKIPIKHNSC